MIAQFKNHSKFYTDYANLRGIRDARFGWGPVTLWLLKVVAPEEAGKKLPHILDSGSLLTWGLFWIATIGWLALALARVIFGK